MAEGACLDARWYSFVCYRVDSFLASNPLANAFSMSRLTSVVFVLSLCASSLFLSLSARGLCGFPADVHEATCTALLVGYVPKLTPPWCDVHGLVSTCGPSSTAAPSLCSALQIFNEELLLHGLRAFLACANAPPRTPKPEPRLPLAGSIPSHLQRQDLFRMTSLLFFGKDHFRRNHKYNL